MTKRILQSNNASRQINGRAVFEAILTAKEPVSRAGLARDLNLSKQTLSEIMALLERSNWVKPSGQKQGAIGRSARTYILNLDAAYVVAVILDGTQFHVAVGDMLGSIRSQCNGVLDPQNTQNEDNLLQFLRGWVFQAVQDAQIPIQLLHHVVIGCPGIVDPITQHVHHCPNLNILETFDLRVQLQNLLNVPVLLENDLNLFAYSEYCYGCSQGSSSSVFLGLGTGLGMGVMIGNQLWRGANGGAGEIGYLPISLQPLLPEEKARGSLETHVQHLIQSKESTATLAQACAFAISSVVAILNPQVIVIGGQLDDPAFHVQLDEWLKKICPDPLTVHRSAIGPDAGIKGAIAIALQQTYQSVFSDPS